MSRKKLRLDRSARSFLEIQPTVVAASLQKFSFWSILGYLCVEGEAIECAGAASATGDFASTMSIRGSWPMAISGYPRGHSVSWVTRCQGTQGRSHGLILP